MVHSKAHARQTKLSLACSVYMQSDCDNVLLFQCIKSLPSSLFPTPTQLFIACSMEERVLLWGLHVHQTIFLYFKGKMKSDEIVLWLKKQTGPLVQDLATPGQASAFSKKYEVVVVGLFQDAESEAANAFISAAAAHYNVYFGITSFQEVANSMNATLNSIVVFNQVSVGG